MCKETLSKNHITSMLFKIKAYRTLEMSRELYNKFTPLIGHFYFNQQPNLMKTMKKEKALLDKNTTTKSVFFINNALNCCLEFVVFNKM